MNHHDFAALSVFLVLVMLGGCQNVPVAEIRGDERFDLSQAETFAWASDHPLYFHELESRISPELEPLMMDHTARWLENNGLKRGGRGNADLLVSFSIGSVRIERNPPVEPTARVYTDLDEWEWYWPDSGIENFSYVAGQVCIDVHSAAEKRRVWHGTVRNLTLPGDGMFQPERTTEIIDLILGHLPLSK